MALGSAILIPLVLLPVSKLAAIRKSWSPASRGSPT